MPRFDARGITPHLPIHCRRVDASPHEYVGPVWWQLRQLREVRRRLPRPRDAAASLVEDGVIATFAERRVGRDRIVEVELDARFGLTCPTPASLVVPVRPYVRLLLLDTRCEELVCTITRTTLVRISRR